MPSSPAAVHIIHAVDTAPIAVGDMVRFGRYRGRVVALNGETAVIHERNNVALGHAIDWRIRLDALTKIEDRDQC